MKSKHHNHVRLIIQSVLSILVIITVTFLFVALPPAHAVSGPIPLTIIGPNGTSYPISDITSMTSTSGWGGYYSSASKLFPGNFTGVSLLSLCNSIGTPLTSNENVTVQTTGGSGTSVTFNYVQVADGTSIYPQYSTYNNVTGALQAPTEPVTLIVAYQYANGTALPGSATTRLLIVGPEGLLFQGTGLAGVSNVTITYVGPALTAPAISETLSSLDQGQTSNLTSSVTTGDSPYTYQWFNEAPSMAYSKISGATQANYTFATSSSTANGAWNFILQVNDSTGASINSTAATITVNSALVAPSLTSSANTVNQGQTSVLSSSTVTTGTSPYTYQWLNEAPGAGVYSPISGATSSSYDFSTSTSTATGTWNFTLQVTDNTTATASSSAIEVTVDALLATPTPTVAPTPTPSPTPTPTLSPTPTTIPEYSEPMLGVTLLVSIASGTLLAVITRRKNLPHDQQRKQCEI